MTSKRVALEQFNIKTSFSAMPEMGFFVDHELAPFDNEATEFCFNNAWWMIDHARLAYVSDQKKVRKILKDAGYTRVKFVWNEETGTKVYVAWNKTRGVISFTGTEPGGGTSDFLTDLDFLPVNSGQGGVVHGGFKKAIDSVWDELGGLIDDLGDRAIWITGHSLGGALAVHAASRILAKGCYTFGSPRVGSKKFNKSILTPIYRVAKSNDIVTRIPTPPVYWHHGDTYFITDKQQVLVNPTQLKMLRERLGGSGWRIAILLIKVFVFKSKLDFIMSYLHGHSPYNYSVFMWNNLDN